MNEEQLDQQESKEKPEEEFNAPYKSRVEDIRGLDASPSIPKPNPQPDSEEASKSLPSVEALGVGLPKVDQQNRVVFNEDNLAEVKDLNKEYYGEEKLEIIPPIPQVFGGKE